MARINHTPDPNPTRAKARARRNINLVVWWGIALLLLFLLSVGAPWVLLLPLLVIVDGLEGVGLCGRGTMSHRASGVSGVSGVSLSVLSGC